MSKNFVEQKIEADIAAGRWGARVVTRFPPEPNGYLHIGHAKAICVNFGLARAYDGACHLRFDDTNPVTEETEYVEAIQDDIRWLGFEWSGEVRYASQYFSQLFEWAELLVGKGKAYVCDLDAEAMREYRGTLTSPGKNSPFRDRSPEENLDLLQRMRAGEFDAGTRTLRAKIDMASPNMNLRDPVMYRIVKERHHRTGDEWYLYPTYDWAHGQSDAIEGITHSLCTLEFENHRALYDWYLEHLELPTPPEQTEFARLELTYVMTSKRKLLALVREGLVDGWDDPRMPTLRGMRRRGYTPASIRALCAEVGVAKFNSRVDFVKLENELRSELNETAPRRLAVLRPLKLVIENWPEGEIDQMDAVNNPQDESAGTRKLPFGREIWIERDDFRIEAPRKYFRLTPGKEVRLRYAWYVTCTGYETDPATGEVTLVRCTYDPESRGGDSPDGRKVRGTIHWVSAQHAVNAPVRLYDHLFAVLDPGDVPEGGDWKDNLNPDSLETIEKAALEASLGDAQPGECFQFERHGYFIADAIDSNAGAPVFNRSVGLRDSWAKIEKKQG